MSDKKNDEKGAPVAFISIQLTATGELKTSLGGDTLTLLGLAELVTDSIKARMNVQPTKTVASDEVSGD